jgi:hypothetical protein
MGHLKTMVESQANTKMSKNQDATYLGLGTLEALLNSFIELDTLTKEETAALTGLIVRIKIIEPYLHFYLIFTDEGIEVAEQSPEPAHVRLNARLIDIIRLVFGTSDNRHKAYRVRLWGQAEDVNAFRSLISNFNLRNRAQEWIQTNTNLGVIWQKILNYDPTWLNDFLPLPKLMREAFLEVKSLRSTVTEQSEQIQKLESFLQKQRHQDILFISLGFILILMSLFFSLGSIDIEDLSWKNITLILSGLVIILFRLRR